MSKFYVDVEMAKKEVGNLREEASSLHSQYKLLQNIASENAISGDAYREVQEVLHEMSGRLLEEERKVRILSFSLNQIVKDYVHAENETLTYISKQGGKAPSKNSGKNKTKPDYDYQKEVQDLYYKLTHPKDMPLDEYIKLLYDLFKRASFTDPKNCTLSKAEKEALLRWIGPLMDKIADIGEVKTGISKDMYEKELIRYILGTDTWNAGEAGLVGAFADPLAKLLGFAYNPETDSYYTKEGCNQQNWGFCDAIDKWGWGLGMDLDTDVTTFQYDGQEFRVQLWKGNYGGGYSVGSEMGIYSRPESEALAQPYEWGSEDSKYILFDSVEDKYQPSIKQTTYYETPDGVKKNFTCDTKDYGDGDDYWNLNIRTDAGIDKSTIHVQYTIDCSQQGEEYARAMYEAYKNDPNLTDVPKIDGTTIIIEY